jgi:FtsZ-binding cell division protein ZapB
MHRETHDMTPAHRPRDAERRAARALVALAFLALPAAAQDTAPAAPAAPAPAAAPAPTLAETRLAMGKWIETQQIISRERNDWQQGKEILEARVQLVQKEVVALQEGIQKAQSGVEEATAKRDALRTENDQLKAAATQLTEAVVGMEARIRELFKSLPEPLRTRLQPLYQRIPVDPADTRVSPAERYQNVLGILNELNKANNDIAVSYEVRTLASGSPSEVKVIYVGLAQAYYVSAGGEAGIGRPTPDGWNWEPTPAIAGEVLQALEILQGKQSPAFVPLPVQLQ